LPALDSRRVPGRTREWGVAAKPGWPRRL